MWVYEQHSGNLSRNGVHVSTGWAGQGQWKNDPASQCVKNRGPLPRGLYKLQTPYTHPHLGPFVMNLEPDPTNIMCGRGDFRMHGASWQHPETSSEGCIIMARSIREAVWNSNDHDLTVVE